MQQKNRFPRPPVIIVGMHRSGTTMLARLLDRLGLFLGSDKDMDHEARFFRTIDDWLLRQSGGSWAHPAPMQLLFANPEVTAVTVDYVRHLLRTPHVLRYLGLRRYLAFRRTLVLDEPWGWKSPRSACCLPLWAQIYPQARVISIYRHGVDVADSLRTRERETVHRERALYERKKGRLLYYLRPRRARFHDMVRCDTLEGGFSLWEEYVDTVRDGLQRTGLDHLEVRYEDFLAEPSTGLRTVAGFAGLEPEAAEIDRAVRDIDPSRACSYRRSDELRAFAADVSARLEMRGY